MDDSKSRQLIEDEGWLYVQVTALDLGNEENERMLALRVASKIEQRVRQHVAIHQRLSIRQVADLRRLNRKPLHERYVERISLTRPLVDHYGNPNHLD